MSKNILDLRPVEVQAKEFAGKIVYAFFCTLLMAIIIYIAGVCVSYIISV